MLGEAGNRRCSFERIYFSRGSDADIYRERKALGRALVPDVLRAVDNDIDHAVLSFIPNTAEVAFIGLVEGFEEHLNRLKTDELLLLQNQGRLSADEIRRILDRKLRVEKVAIKDIKLRTFIAEGASRNDLAAHVYDVTYGCITDGVDSVVVIDDSIVRGTTLRQSIIGMLDRLHPKRIVIVSSSPQVRYPDYYGIDMSRMSEFIAFRAAIALLHDRGMDDIIDKVYQECRRQLELPVEEQTNAVKAIYEPFSAEEISEKMVEMLKPEGVEAEVKIVYQSIAGLHRAVPDCPGDWYFSGDYPTPGGNRLANLSFINYYEGCPEKRSC